jgi:hypothetical protein
MTGCKGQNMSYLFKRQTSWGNVFVTFTISLHFAVRECWIYRLTGCCGRAYLSDHKKYKENVSATVHESKVKLRCPLFCVTGCFVLENVGQRNFLIFSEFDISTFEDESHYTVSNIREPNAR